MSSVTDKADSIWNQINDNFEYLDSQVGNLREALDPLQVQIDSINDSIGDVESLINAL